MEVKTVPVGCGDKDKSPDQGEVYKPFSVVGRRRGKTGEWVGRTCATTDWIGERRS